MEVEKDVFKTYIIEVKFKRPNEKRGNITVGLRF